MPTYKDHVSDELGRDQLASLVSEDRHTDDEQFVPPRVKTSVAHDFLTEVVKIDLKIERTQRAADVARFYVLRALVSEFTKLAHRAFSIEADVFRDCLERHVLKNVFRSLRIAYHDPRSRRNTVTPVHQRSQDVLVR